MKRYVTSANPPRKWNRCAWRPGFTPYSPLNDGSLQVTDAESRKFIEAADGGALLVDMEPAHERCAELTRAAVGSLWRNWPRRRYGHGPIFINSLNPQDETAMAEVLDIFTMAGVVTVGGYIADSAERSNDGVLLGSSFERDTDRVIKRAKLWRDITSLPLCVQIMDKYNYPDVSQDGQWIGTNKPMSDADLDYQAMVLAPHVDMVLYWTPDEIDQRVIRAWGTR
jgi:hypothetical protein